MPIVQEIKGDLISHIRPGELGCKGPIAHGVNCKGKMNSGVAKAIRETFPHVYDAYMDHVIRESTTLNKLLGTVQPVDVSDNSYCKTVFNMFTQEHYGYDGKQYASYEAIESCFYEVNKLLKASNDLLYEIKPRPLGIPKIGSGLGGGDWNTIKAIIDNSTPNIPVWVYEL